MTEIEKQALALLNELSDYEVPDLDEAQYSTAIQALYRAIEQHEQFKRDVSDAVEDYLAHMSPWPDNSLRRFILPKPDKQLRSIAADRLVYAASEYFCNRKNNLELIDAIVELAASAALAKRGLEVREIEG